MRDDDPPSLGKLLDSIYNDHAGTFSIVAQFLDQRHPGWSDGIAKDRRFNPLLPLPVDWNGRVEVVGLVQSHRTRTSADNLGVAPQLFGLYAGRRDGNFVWLGAAACETDAHALVKQLG